MPKTSSASSPRAQLTRIGPPAAAALVLTLIILAAIGVQIGTRQRALAQADTDIAEAIINEQIIQMRDGYLSPENSLVVKVAPNLMLEPYHWMSEGAATIWKYQGGKLQTAANGDLERARQLRTVLIFIFSVQRENGKELWADVATFYPTTKTAEMAGGGNGSHWRFARLDGQWELENIDAYIYWD
jgi:hypothetical protein